MKEWIVVFLADDHGIEIWPKVEAETAEAAVTKQLDGSADAGVAYAIERASNFWRITADVTTLIRPAT